MAFALVCGLRKELNEEERYRVADDVVHQPQQNGDPWQLSEDLPPPGKEHSTPTTHRSAARPISSWTARRDSIM
jgi:hypothetical protein